MHIDLVIGVAVIATAAFYIIPTLNLWKARRAFEKRLKQAIKG